MKCIDRWHEQLSRHRIPPDDPGNDPPPSPDMGFFPGCPKPTPTATVQLTQTQVVGAGQVFNGGRQAGAFVWRRGLNTASCQVSPSDVTLLPPSQMNTSACAGTCPIP